MEGFWKDDIELANDLATVRERMQEVVDNSHGFIRKLLQTQVNSGGKMLRPALVLLSSQLGTNPRKEQVLKIASILEMIHIASLIHDDILDMALTRRGVATLYAKVGAKQAVLAGDYLLSKAISMIGSNEDNGVKASAVANAFSRLCESELDQDAAQNDFFISKSTYIRRIAGKTAALFALCCYSGAATADASEHQQYLMHRFGYAFGMSFQVQDDILDYVGNEQDLGKQTGRDLQCGIPTLPLIFALEEERRRGPKRPLAALLTDRGSHLNNKDTAKAVSYVIQLGGIERATAVSDMYRNRALRDLQSVDNAEVAAKLKALFVKLINRPS
ncbi:MAG: polyprenyl synthetase family protein [Sphaerochaetaceae bacterium]|jgi:heptaprenyl diphosphate synthase|nr:polyprenyl synthetase family protein [Sphaerochaetaceae bacterium]